MTDFQTHEEEDAFNSYLSSTDEDEIRNDRDEAILRNGWFAARDYFSKPTSGKTETSDAHLREIALAFATQHSDGLGAASVVLKAEAFLSFLQTGKKPEEKS